MTLIYTRVLCKTKALEVEVKNLWSLLSANNKAWRWCLVCDQGSLTVLSVMETNTALDVWCHMQGLHRKMCHIAEVARISFARVRPRSKKKGGKQALSSKCLESVLDGKAVLVWYVTQRRENRRSLPWSSAESGKGEPSEQRTLRPS